MNKFQSYKSSGVEWIGEIPENWELKKLKHITEYKNGVSFKSDFFSKDEKIPVIRIGDVGDVIDFDDCVKLPVSFLDEYSNFIVKRGDILVGLTGGTIGKSGRYNYDNPSLLNQRVCILRNTKDVENKLLYYYVKSEVFIRYIFFNCYGGGQDNIGKEDIINMVFPLPPISEQLQIVQFLDEKTELIDNLISTKERKIDLLKQQRTSLINEVITKGLNPDVRMKDSGVEWLKEIPEHWNISRLKYLGDLYGGLTGKSGVDFNNDENPKNKPYIPYTNIFNNTYISKDHFHYVSIDEGEIQNRVKKYDMFFLMSSETFKDLGKSCILIDDVDELYLNSFCKGYRIKDENIYPLFLNYQILGHLHREMISYEGKGFTRINLRQDKLNDLFVFYPPLPEQLQIVDFLDTRTKEIDDLVSMEQKKIDLLKEYRQSLISEVITGKIDVRTNLN